MTRMFNFWLVLALTTCFLPVVVHGDMVMFGYIAEEVGGPGIATGVFSYDLNAPDQQPGDPVTGEYAAFFSVSVSGGSQDGGSFAVNDTIFVTDRTGGTPPDVIQPLNEVGPSANPSFLGLAAPNTTLNSDALPPSINLAQFTVARELVLWNEDLGLSGEVNVDYLVTSVSLIPEPGTTLLLLCGMSLLSLTGRQKRRHRQS